MSSELPLVRVLALRHARPLQTGVCYGQSDVPVEQHASQVERLCEQLRALREAAEAADFSVPRRLFTSPLRRCRGLGEALSKGLGWPVVECSQLAELSLGEFEGRRYSDLYTADHERFQTWSTNWQIAAPPGGESLSQLEARVYDALHHVYLRHAPARRCHIWVTHAGVIRALRVLLSGSTWEEAIAADVPHLQWISVDGSSGQKLSR